MTERSQTADPTLAAVALLKGLGWNVTPPDGLRYGCHVELFALPEGTEPDGCVIDEGARNSCIYARDIACKEQCRYWQAITSESIRKARGE